MHCKIQIMVYAIIAICFFHLFVGCARENNISTWINETSGNNANSTTGQTGKKYDYTQFSFPVPTDEIVVWLDGTEADSISAAEVYKELYPEVTLRCEHFNQDEYSTLLRAELAAGRGPDLIYCKENDLPDIYKTMKTKIFEDLAPYLASDTDLDLSVFQTGVLEGGQIDGKQYILPIKYQLPVYLTTEEFLHECGVTSETLSTYDGFINLAMSLREKMPDTHLLFWGVLQGADVVYPRELYLDLGFSVIDYNAETVDIDADKFRQYADLCRTWYDKGPGDWAPLSVESLTNRINLFFNFAANKPEFLSDGFYLRQSGETPVYAVIPDQYDGVTAQITRYGAIPVGSKNKYNAWQFMKILLSEDVLVKNDAPMSFGIPVRNDCLRLILDKLSETEEVTEKETDAYYEAAQKVTRSITIPPIILTYIKENMEPYFRNQSSFEACYKDLLNVLEIYKDE